MAFAQILPLDGLLCLVAALALVVAVLAVVLLAAVWLYNKLAGGAGAPEAVPEPSFGKALGIAVVAILVSFGVRTMLELAAGAMRTHPAAVHLVSLPADFLVMSVLLAAMLPTSFGKGAVLALLYSAIVMAVAAAVFAVLLVQRLA